MDVSLTGRSAMITGASKGLGLAMATEFAASGADVAILARRPAVLEEARAQIEKTAKGRVATIPCDVAQAEQCRQAYDTTMRAFGKVDILVNNAGISRAMPFEQITDEIWHEDLELKLFAAIRLTRLVFPQMKERRWGRIINVLNIGAKAPRAGGAPTSISRAAGMALTKVLAGEGAPHNVLVNAMLVGQIVSDQWVRRHQAQGATCRSRILSASSAPAFHWGDSAKLRNSPRWRVSWPPTMPASRPERRSTWTAERRRLSDKRVPRACPWQGSRGQRPLALFVGRTPPWPRRSSR